MKVVIASGIYEPEIGGPATYVKSIATALSKKGWTVEVVTWSSVKHHKNDARAPYNIYRIMQRGKLGLLAYTRKLLQRSKDASIIFAQGPLHEGLPALLVSKLLRKKLVVRIPGDQAWEAAQNKGLLDSIEVFQKKQYGITIKRNKWIQQRVLANADAIIVPSKYLKNLVRRWTSGEKIHVVHNAAVPVENCTEKIKHIQTPYFISAGRFVPWKNFGRIIDAFNALSSINMRLVLVGSGPQKAYLEKKIGNNKNIMIVAPVQKQLLYKYLKKAHGFILASNYEGFPHILLEAMQTGIPVIASNIPANKELVIHKKNGLLFNVNSRKELTNALQTLLSNKKLRQTLRRNSLQTIKKFSPQKMIQETEFVLKSVLT